MPANEDVAEAGTREVSSRRSIGDILLIQYHRLNQRSIGTYGSFVPRNWNSYCSYAYFPHV